MCSNSKIQLCFDGFEPPFMVGCPWFCSGGVWGHEAPPAVLGEPQPSVDTSVQFYGYTHT